MSSVESPYLGQGCTTPTRSDEILQRLLWAFVQATLFRWSPRPFHGFRAWLLRGFGATIPVPSQVVIFPTARITYPWRLTLAARAMVGPRVMLYNLGHIELRRGANVSQNCHLCSGSHDYAHWSMPLVTGKIVIGENAWLGADVFVGPDVNIGELCVVGARSVVVRDLPARMVCVGHPCRPIHSRPEPTAD
jgi:putative colanic acid biosynthesis acetyltransferase WcaF